MDHAAVASTDVAVFNVHTATCDLSAESACHRQNITVEGEDREASWLNGPTMLTTLTAPFPMSPTNNVAVSIIRNVNLRKMMSAKGRVDTSDTTMYTDSFFDSRCMSLE